MANALLHHFSEDPSIERFVPHVPKTNPSQQPAVWAIDTEHSPLYWFPRDCPRATAWPRGDDGRADFERTLATTATRLHAIEYSWLRRMRTATLYRYDFEPTTFEPWEEAHGQWISRAAVQPATVTRVGNLLDAHASAGIELRVLVDLWPLVELMSDDRWDFSHVRLANTARVR